VALLEGTLAGLSQEEQIFMRTSVDKLVFRFAGGFVLTSLLLAQVHSPYWLWFTAFIGANMLQASFTGFCPLAKILASLGAPYGEAFRASNTH
jgi:hypothetical protein